MRYLFADVATGALIELDYPMAEAPELGSIVESEGRRLRRLPSQVQAKVEPDLRHVAWSQRRREDTPEALQKYVPHWHKTETGAEFPRFDTKQEIAEYQAASEGALKYE